MFVLVFGLEQDKCTQSINQSIIQSIKSGLIKCDLKYRIHSDNHL